MAKSGKELILEFPTENDKIEIGSLTTDRYKLFFNESTINKGILKPDYVGKRGTKKLIVKKEFFSEDKKVQDRHRYNLTCHGGQWVLKTPCNNIPSKKNVSQCDKKITKTPEANNILVILESPHKKEYEEDSNGKLSPLRPANGTTGQTFLEYFCSHVLPILESFGLILCTRKEYNICFVNPVPFQTSLNFLHEKKYIKKGKQENKEVPLQEKTRNEVWNALYPKCENDFKNRIQSYNPVIILNGCTSSKVALQKTLKEQVTETINGINFSNTSMPQKFKVTHPSSWNTLVYGKF